MKSPAKKNSMSHVEILSLKQLSKLSITFWVGGTLTIGVVLIPILLRVLDQITASVIIDQILTINAYIGIISLSIALINNFRINNFKMLKMRSFWYIITMQIILLINHFAVLPIVNNVRKKISLLANKVTVQYNWFEDWNSVSAVLFIITCIIAVFYVLESDR